MTPPALVSGVELATSDYRVFVREVAAFLTS